MSGNTSLNGTLQIAGALTIDPSETTANVQSGTYSATITAEANCSVSSPATLRFMRVGNMVVVSGEVICDPVSANTDTYFLVSLPFAVSATSGKVSGNYVRYESTSSKIIPGIVWGAGTSNSPRVYFFPQSTDNQSGMINFMFEIN